MNLGPFARILLRYGIGFLAGSQIGEQLAMDQDIVTAVAMAMGVAVEAVYVIAKRKGWSL